MCGIFGLAKKADSQNDFHIEKSKEMIANLAEESSVRGIDSTGLAFISENSRTIWKSVMPSYEMVEHPDWDKKIITQLDRSTTAVIGHVRYATHGTVSIRNAHPFQMGEVMGAHNGVLSNHNKLADKMGKKIEVDSEVIFGALNRYKMKTALEKLDGDYAITFVKKDSSVVHLARESSRPMNVAYWKKARTLFWASTEEILQNALNLSGLGSLKCMSIKDSIIYSLQTEKFGKKPVFLEEAFKPKESFYSYGSYNKNYYSNYSGSGERCLGCNAITYSKDKLCWDCKEIHKGSTVNKQCDKCSCWTEKDNLTYLKDLLSSVCTDCYEEYLQPLKTSKHHDQCDWCGDWVQMDEMAFYGTDSLCVDCVVDYEDAFDYDKNVLLLKDSTIERFDVEA